MKLKYFAIFDEGRVVSIVRGYKVARRVSPHRAYKSFACEIDAQEFAMWWNHDHSRWWHSLSVAPRDEHTLEAAASAA